MKSTPCTTFKEWSPLINMPLIHTCHTHTTGSGKAEKSCWKDPMCDWREGVLPWKRSNKTPSGGEWLSTLLTNTRLIQEFSTQSVAVERVDWLWCGLACILFDTVQTSWLHTVPTDMTVTWFHMTVTWSSRHHGTTCMICHINHLLCTHHGCSIILTGMTVTWLKDTEKSYIL